MSGEIVSARGLTKEVTTHHATYDENEDKTEKLNFARITYKYVHAGPARRRADDEGVLVGGFPNGVESITVLSGYNAIISVTFEDGLFGRKTLERVKEFIGKGPVNGMFGPYFGNSEQEFMVVSDKAFFITRDGGKTWKDVAPAFVPPDGLRKSISPIGAFNYFGWDAKNNIIYASSLSTSVYRLKLQP